MSNPFKGLQMQAWHELKQSGGSVRVAFQPRAAYAGRSIMPELWAQAGVHLKLRPLWLMEEDDPYPGEWALGAADGRSDVLGRAWIASGDVVICPAEVNV